MRPCRHCPAHCQAVRDANALGIRLSTLHLHRRGGCVRASVPVSSQSCEKWMQYSTAPSRRPTPPSRPQPLPLAPQTLQPRLASGVWTNRSASTWACASAALVPSWKSFSSARASISRHALTVDVCSLVLGMMTRCPFVTDLHGTRLALSLCAGTTTVMERNAASNRRVCR